MNKKNWVKALALLPVLLYMMFINYSIDPANIYHDASKEIANSLLGGQAASFGTGNGNEREVKRNLIIGMPVSYTHLDVYKRQQVLCRIHVPK